MKIGGSTNCSESIKSQLERLKSIGYDFAEVDLSLPIMPDEKFKKEIKANKEIIPLFSGHLPSIDFKKEELERCKEFIKILSNQDVNLFVIHLYSNNLPTKENFEFKLKCLEELTDFARRFNSVLVLENTEEDISILKKVFEKVPDLKFCLDVGHANLFTEKNSSVDLIENFQDVLEHVHVHDNIGGYREIFDSHFPVGVGNIDFLLIFKKLKETGYSGRITLEIFNIDKKYEIMGLEKTREIIF